MIPPPAPRRSPCSRSRALVGTVFATLLLAACATTLDREELAAEYFNIGTAYFDLGDLERSATFLTRAIELNPELARASYNLARVFIEQNQFPRAIELLQELLALDPGNSLILETLGYAEYRAGNLPAAGEWYDRALDQNGTDTDLLRNRATIHRELAEYAPAATLLERASALSGDDLELRLEIARTFALAGEPERAVESYERYLADASPPESSAYLEVADLYEELEFYADSLSALSNVTESATAPASDRSLAWARSAEILYLAADEPDAGLEAMREAIASGFGDSERAVLLLNELPDAAQEPLRELLEASGLLSGEGPDEAVPEASPDGETSSGTE